MAKNRIVIDGIADQDIAESLINTLNTPQAQAAGLVFILDEYEPGDEYMTEAAYEAAVPNYSSETGH